jgi:hypothetical protein
VSVSEKKHHVLISRRSRKARKKETKGNHEGTKRGHILIINYWAFSEVTIRRRDENALKSLNR